MLLRVKGIGKIKDSTITMNGITVIAGENNAGKSTFGKVLYCVFHSFNNPETRINNERIKDIAQILGNHFHRLPNNLLDRKYIEEYFGNDDIREKIEELISTVASYNKNLKINANTIDLMYKNIKRSVSIGKEEIHKMLITRCFRQEFAGKINHANRPDMKGEIFLEIKKRPLKITIKADECVSYSDDIGLIHNAIFLDTPFVMDDIKNFYGHGFTGFYNMIKHRDDLLERLIKQKSSNTILEEVIFKKKLNSVLSEIRFIIGGEFEENENDLLFSESGIKNPMPLSSVSTGIKVFLVIKRLLELGEIKERDILILDEPEIHLHPDWQIKLAEILVLLQKEFSLTILLTTHSPYFLHAIEVFSKKHNSLKQLTCYLAETDDDTSFIKEVTDCIDTVYKKMALPFQKLEDIKYSD